MVKHKINRFRNSNGTLHFEVGAPVRQVADRTIAPVFNGANPMTLLLYFARGGVAASATA